MTHYETYYKQKEKINQDIKPQSIKITITPSEELKKSGCSYVKFKLALNETKIVKGKLDIDKSCSTVLFIEDKTSWKLVDKKELTINLKKKKFLFGQEIVDTKKFKLTELGFKCDLEKVVKLSKFDATFLF